MCLVPAVCLTARTLSRSFQPSLLIPSWEGLSADPEEKRGPCDRHQHRLDGEIRKRLTPTRPNREGTAIWLLAQLSATLPRHPDRMLALLRKPVSSMIQASIGPSRSIAGRTVAPPAPSRPTTKPGRQNAAKIDAGPPSEPAPSRPPSVPHSCA